MSLSKPNSCRIDTFMSGRPASVTAVIAPPWPRLRPRRESADKCGSDVAANLAESAWPAEAPRRDPWAAKNGYLPRDLYRRAATFSQPLSIRPIFIFLVMDQRITDSLVRIAIGNRAGRAAGQPQT